MKHLKQGKKFSRKKKQRKALIRTMLGSLLKRKRIETTEAKAKELKRITDRIVSKAKRLSSSDGEKMNIALLRQIRRDVPQDITISELKSIAGSFAGRSGGYTRVLKKEGRRSDGAKLAVIEFVK